MIEIQTDVSKDLWLPWYRLSIFYVNLKMLKLFKLYTATDWVVSFHNSYVKTLSPNMTFVKSGLQGSQRLNEVVKEEPSSVKKWHQFVHSLCLSFSFPICSKKMSHNHPGNRWPSPSQEKTPPKEISLASTLIYECQVPVVQTIKIVKFYYSSFRQQSYTFISSLFIDN
jgi:hypothetical protein